MKSVLLGGLLFVVYSSFYILRLIESHYFLFAAIICFPLFYKCNIVHRLLRKRIVIAFVLGNILVFIAVVFSYGAQHLDVLKFSFYFIINFSVLVFLYEVFHKHDLNKVFCVFSVLCLILFSGILLAPLLLPGMTMSKVLGVGRLASGANPNFISYLGLSYILVYWLVKDFIAKKNLYQFVAFLGLFVGLWGMSRSVVFSAFLAVMTHIFLNLYLTAINLKISKSILLLLIAVLVMAASLPLWYDFLPIERLGSSNLSSRALAWQILLDHFYQKPMFGYTGWYRSSELLPLSERDTGIASSAHNAYVSLLSEVGTVGLLGFLIFPFTILFYGFKGLANSVNNSKVYSKYSLIISAVVYILMREMLEKNLFYNYMDLPMFLLLLVFVVLTKRFKGRENYGE